MKLFCVTLLLLSKGSIVEVMQDFKGVFTVLVADYQDLYIIIKRSTLENLHNQLSLWPLKTVVREQCF